MVFEGVTCDEFVLPWSLDYHNQKLELGKEYSER